MTTTQGPRRLGMPNTAHLPARGEGGGVRKWQAGAPWGSAAGETLSTADSALERKWQRLADRRRLIGRRGLGLIDKRHKLPNGFNAGVFGCAVSNLPDRREWHAGELRQALSLGMTQAQER